MMIGILNHLHDSVSFSTLKILSKILHKIRAPG